MPTHFPSAFRAHPWHGVDPGPDAPSVVTSFIEIVPADTVKYEVDKATGLLKVDRPQRFSNVCPALYGFVPRTLCAERVGAYCSEKTGRVGIIGDGDPLDICVLTEKSLPRGDVLIQAIPIGGLRMIDINQADDKVIAVMRDDAVYGHLTDIRQCPAAVIERLRHYFLTYKLSPGSPDPVEITHVYSRSEAHEVIRRSVADYNAAFRGAAMR
ncbi:inorganic pyrophosphatase [Povalibacter sp.]|uniref:inorganic pyrophosphatase n=1 Tax=Povalibacter sp. TaxID=1962978 RepID=UPI002F3FFAB3